MITTTYTNARKDLKNFMDKVCNNVEPVFVKRKNGKNVVIISEEEYLGLDETAYLLSAPTNQAHLKKSLQELKQNQTQSVSLDDL